MTPEAAKAIRKRARLTQGQVARIMRISDRRSIQRWEDGDRAVSGPASMLYEMLDAGELPARYLE